MAYKPKTFDPASKEPFSISRSKIDLFTECPRCFYLEARLGVRRPDGPAFTLNNAVDALLKKEFDTHRARGTKHPLFKTYGVDAVPFPHEKLEEWRDARTRGVKFLHEPTNLLVRGGIDDLWKNPKGELIVVDYKATSKKDQPVSEADLYDSYKRQVEVYQWLFRRNGFMVSPIGYFVYVNGRTDAKAFDGKLEFDVALIPYRGNDAWVEKTLYDIRKTLESDTIPRVGKAFGGGPCDFCSYREAAGEKFQALAQKERAAHTAKAKPGAKHARSLFD